MSENKLIKKYIGTDQVGASQLELENNSAVRSKSADGLSSQDLMKLDPSNLLQMLKQPHLPGNASSALEAIPKQQLDAAVSGIETDISGLQDQITQEISDREAADAVLQGEIDQVETNLAQEVSDREAADSLLQGEIDAEEIARANADIQLQQHIDDEAAARLAGDTNLQNQIDGINSDISALEAEDLTFVKLDGSRAMTGSLDMGTHKITNLGTPTSANDAVTKAYADSIAEGLHVHAPVKVIISQTLESLTGGTVTYSNGVDGVGATLVLQNPLTSYDTYTFQDGDRVIVNGQANKAYNGIYTVGSNGTLGSVFTRASDYNTPTEMAGGDFVFVQDGDQYADTGWVQVDTVLVVGTDPVQFVQFSGAGAYTAGQGLELDGTQFNVLFDGASVSLNGSNQLEVAPSLISSLESQIDTVQSNLDAEASTREAADVLLQGQITNEEAARIAADAVLQGQITTLQGDMVIAQQDIVDIKSDITDLQAEDLTFLKLDGSRAMTGALNMGTHKISNLVDPTLPQDAASKAYVDSQISGAGLTGGQAISISSGVVNALFDNSTVTLNGSNQLQVSSTVMGRISTLETEMNAAQADIISLDGRVDSLETRMTAAEAAIDALELQVSSIQTDVNVLIPEMSQAQSDISALQSGLAQEILDREAADLALQGEITQEISDRTAADLVLQGEIEQEISDREAADLVLQGQIDTLNTEMDAAQADIIVLEERSEIIPASAYNSFASVYADAQPGQLDPTSITNPRHGWYFKNSVAGQKINWYFFDGINQANISLGNFSAYAVMTFDAVVSPILAVYTVPTGSGDAMPGFAHSRVVYNGFDGVAPVAGQKCVVYFGQEPVAHPELPKFKLLKSAGNSIGDQNPAEQVLTSSFGSNSSNPVNTIQYMVESLGVESPLFRGEVELEIRPAFREIDGSIKMLSARITDLADPIAPQDAASKAYVDSMIASGTDFEVQKIVLSAADVTNQYIDLSFKAAEGSVISSSARVNLIVVLGVDADADFRQDNTGLVTRLHFQGPSAIGGESELSEGQVIYFNFVKA